MRISGIIWSGVDKQNFMSIGATLICQKNLHQYRQYSFDQVWHLQYWI